jgi:pimeloyl-ACP methyl ester carboxylesterase
MVRVNRVIRRIAFVMLVAAAPLLAASRWQVTPSADGVPIAYQVLGKGDTTLIFVHGWSCDSRYWQQQIDAFAKKYEVVTIDLAGHGHSGLGRTDYTMQSFGSDVKAVADAVAAGKIILIGHSMGGIVIAEAAALLPGRVIGIIGIDTIENVEIPITQQQVDTYTSAFEKGFPAAARPFIASMLVKDTDPALASWITEDVAAAPPAVGISALNEMMGMYVRGEIPKLFDGLSIPVRCVSSDLWPIDYEANRRHMSSFDAKVLKGRGHFLMLEKPAEFNKLLKQTIEELVTVTASSK